MALPLERRRMKGRGAPLQTGAQQHDDFRVLRKAAGAVLGVQQRSVGGDVEYAAAALDQVGVDAEFLRDRGLQTGGLRAIVSGAAVFDGDFHGVGCHGWRVMR